MFIDGVTRRPALRQEGHLLRHERVVHPAESTWPS